MKELEHILGEMDPILLEEMDGVALLNRQDTKFVFARKALVPLLAALQSHYRVLEVAGNRQMAYSTQYFDTPDLYFYRLHHNGKRNRVKVRLREYLDSGLRFLEVKQKSNKGRTDKSRIRFGGEMGDLGNEGRAFVNKTCSLEINLVPTLNNLFNRITLVHKVKKERFTIDCDLRYNFNGLSHNLPNAVIAEVKQERANRNTASMSLLKNLGIRPQGISKYCMGITMVHAGMKCNNFKPTTRLLQSL